MKPPPKKSMILNCISIYKNRFLINHNFKWVFLIHITEVLKFSKIEITHRISLHLLSTLVSLKLNFKSILKKEQNNNKKKTLQFQKVKEHRTFEAQQLRTSLRQ